MKGNHVHSWQKRKDGSWCSCGEKQFLQFVEDDSFEGNKAISLIGLSYIRILAEQCDKGKVNTLFIENEAQRLLEQLRGIKI